jgi:acyl dehydratase
MQREASERSAAGVPVARMGPSPGFDELKWLKPVYAGDRISFASEVIAKRESRSRPGWGVVSIKNVGRNQAGDDVLSFVGHVFVERQSAAAES